jgi:signal transduction histidine kinase
VLLLAATGADTTDRVRVQAALRRSEERLRLLDAVAQATRDADDARPVMRATARVLGEYLGATRCAYADVEPDGDRFTIRDDWSDAGVATSAGAYSLDRFGPRAAADMRAGRPLVVRDVDRELGPAGGADMFTAVGIKAVVCYPLVKGGRLVAMMAVHQAAPRDWSADEVALVGEVADRSWAHVERVRAADALREEGRRKDEFLATLAHELRNPLAPIRNAVAVLKLGPPPAEGARFLGMIERQLGQMAHLVDDLLDVSRVSRGKVTLRAERLDLRSGVGEAVETSRPAVDLHRHELTVALPDAPVWVAGDRTRLVQVLTNLVTNAAKYTADGGRIELTLVREGEQAVVRVADSGVGIPADMLPKVFDLFTQVDRNFDRAQGGLGIGLALVKKLVELHGGAVSAESPGPDRGSTFTVRLPLAGDGT